ncbi:MAG: sulfatase-like hydrolase/transferase [Phycisphaeraceae bacterium]
MTTIWIWIFALLTLITTSVARAQPNVVLIVIDDLGYADLGVYGSPDIITPHIDALARDGVRFTRAYVSSPICAPSRAGLITGRYQNRFGFEDNGGPDPEPAFGLPPSETTIAESLRCEGYRTAMIGKWDMGQRDGTRPLDHGFERFYGFLTGVNQHLRAADGENLVHGRSFPIYEGDRVVDEPEYLTDAFAREAVRFVEADQDRPFFLYLSFSAVHTPMQATPRYLDRFAHLAGERRVYAAMVSAIDDAVGRVRAACQRLDAGDGTLFFLISDNGGASGPGYARQSPASNAPLGGRKATFWEGGVRVPFIIAWPERIAASQILVHPVSSLDIHTTALSAAEIEFAGARPLDGHDLMPRMTGQCDVPPVRSLYWRYHDHAAIVRENWKLILFANGERQLFDLKTDVGETTNLVEKYPSRYERLRRELGAWEAGLAEPAWIRRKLDSRGRRLDIRLPIFEPAADPSR